MKNGLLKWTAAVVLGGFVAASSALAGDFDWSAEEGNGNLTVSVRISPGFYLYAGAEELAITVKDAAGTIISASTTPPPAKKPDPISGKEMQLYPSGDWSWLYRGRAPFQITVAYQGCGEAKNGKPGICFLPLEIQLSATPTGAEQPLSPPAILTPETGTVPANIAGDIPNRFTISGVLEGTASEAEFLAFLQGTSASEAGDFLLDRSMWAVLLLTLLGGLGLNLTPCVLPMIPVNLAIIGAAGADKSAGFRRGLAYGAGMTTAYGILGVAVVLGGARFGELNASGMFNFAIAGIFLVLALAMFGVFSLDFSAHLGKVDPGKLPGGKTIGAFFLGALAALLAGACVAPVVIGVLLLAGNLYAEGRWFGLALPFLLGAGMALPWPLAGAGLGVLPKPGAYMEKIKYAFGIIILGAALYYGYVGWTLLPGKYSVEKQFAKLSAGLTESEESGKPLLIDFYATWCKNCKAMERDVLSAAAVKSELSRFVMVKFQAEKPSEKRIAALFSRFKLNGMPAFVLLTPPPLRTGEK